MTANERLIIRDYLTRKRWYFAVGFIIHLVAMTGCWWMGAPLMFGIYGGSAFILMFELQRGGNATTRTMLSLPVTADQLARCWRFVALAFPVVLFLIALLLSTGIGAAFGARRLTAEFFFLIAICQTLFLGTSYFALTGMPGQPGTGASIWQRVQDTFFGIIWGLSIPATLFLSQAIPRHFADLGRGRIIAGILMAVATVAAWFRADVLVRKRAARPGTGVRKTENLSPARSASQWQRFGAMPYLCLRFGSLALATIMTILLVERFAVGWLTSHPTNFIKSQSGMMVVMTVLITLCNLLAQLRVLRTMPIRTSALTHWLIFYPLGIAMIAWLLAQLAFSRLDGAPVEWQLLRNSVFGVVSMTILLPLMLRFGFRVWTLLPVLMFSTIIASSGHLLVSGFSAIHWGWLLAGITIFLVVLWWISYRLLGTRHPWRANAMKGLMAARRM